MITQELLKSKLNYDSCTGIFTWRETRTGTARKGSIAGTRYLGGYIYIQVNSKRYLAHRIAWMYTHGAFPPDGLDHIDGNPANNAISNLRPATQRQNTQNQRIPQTHNTTGFLGVSLNKLSGKFRSLIRINGKLKHLGYFKTAEEASIAYLTAKRELHEFCTI